jgi:ATP-dependent Clp protease ATP-binding subunit ClpA
MTSRFLASVERVVCIRSPLSLNIIQPPRPKVNARPLKRAIQEHVQNPLALALLQGQFQRGDAVVADVEGGRIVFAKEAAGEVV